jgi:hypothetical protein
MCHKNRLIYCMLAGVAALLCLLFPACSMPQPGGDASSSSSSSDNFDSGFTLSTLPTPTNFPTKTPTPSESNIGSGEVLILQKSELEGEGGKDEFKMRVVIPFKIFWDTKAKVWKAQGDSVIAAGTVDLNSNYINCGGIFEGNTSMYGDIVPPETLITDKEGCKLVAHFTQVWGGINYFCNTGFTFYEEETTHNLGPVTFNLRLGDEQVEAFQKVSFYDTYTYRITKLKLPFGLICVDLEKK